MNSRKLLALALGFTVAVSAYAATTTAPAKKNQPSSSLFNVDSKSGSNSDTGKSAKPADTPATKPIKNPPAAK